MRDFDKDRPRIKPTHREMSMDLARWRAIRELLKENSFGCEIHIADFKIGVCDNSELLPIVESNIKEIEKSWADEPNKYD